MISARGLTMRFGSQAVLDGIDLRIDPGERVAVLGLNGAGKTTLFRCFLGLVRYGGSLEIEGVDAGTSPREVRGRIGYVPQRAPHFAGSLAELVEFYGGLRGVGVEAIAGRMEALGLSFADHASKPVRALSGGMLQKALLALATAADAPLLLLDEPTANLDPRARREFAHALGEVPDGTTIVLSSHRLDDIRAVAERLILLHGGRIVFDGTYEDLERAADPSPTLWLDLGADGVRRIEPWLERDPVAVVRRNGSRIGVRAAPAELAAFLGDVRGSGVEIRDLRTESPSLERLLSRYLEGEAR
jgi:ABC-type multidrug transport system ATPase subunit